MLYKANSPWIHIVSIWYLRVYQTLRFFFFFCTFASSRINCKLTELGSLKLGADPGYLILRGRGTGELYTLGSVLTEIAYGESNTLVKPYRAWPEYYSKAMICKYFTDDFRTVLDICTRSFPHQVNNDDLPWGIVRIWKGWWIFQRYAFWTWKLSQNIPWRMLMAFHVGLV